MQCSKSLTLDVNPDWEHAGERIAFASGRGSYIEIPKIGVDGRGLANLTESRGVFRGPCWLPARDKP